jgi:hypothetical protein
MIGGSNCGGWPAIFVVFGCLGIFWFPFFIWIVHSTPREHPSITKAELDIIYKDKESYEPLLKYDSDDPDTDVKRVAGLSSAYTSRDGADPTMRHRSMSSEILYDAHANDLAKERKVNKDYKDLIPWGEFFTNPVSLTLLLNNFTFGWIGFMLLSEIPAYLTDELGFDLESAGALAVLPYAANFISAIGYEL